MKLFRVLLSIALLLVSAHRLPAPISEAPEATPVPKPKPSATAKAKPKSEVTPKPKSQNLSFAGTWAGTANITASDGSSGSCNYLIKISDDEKTALVNVGLVGKAMSGPAMPFSCTRFRDSLTWSDSAATGFTTYTMKVTSAGTASILREGRYIGGELNGVTYAHTGTISRQDISSAPSTSQPTTTTAAPQTTGIPTAKPVPNKPGFVFSPFDPKGKAILDVKGRASGTRVKDSAGRVFIVP